MPAAAIATKIASNEEKRFCGDPLMRSGLRLLGFSRSQSGNRGAVRRRGRSYCRSVGVTGPGELGRIGTGGQEKPNFLAVLGIVIVLFNAFADFCGSNANDRISISVVIRRAVKDLDAQDSFLKSCPWPSSVRPTTNLKNWA